MASVLFKHLVLVTLLQLTCTTYGFSNSSDITDVFPDLADLKNPRGKGVGNQNWTYCCLAAFNEAVTLDANGSVTVNNGPDWEISVDGSELVSSQFPCGAQYDGSPTGAPEVRVSYGWCSSRCGGWSRSHSRQLNQWVQPFVGFILPGLVFCLPVPRRRKLNVPDVLFKPNPGKTGHLLLPFIYGPIAAVMVTIDTLIWLAVMFAMAGPILFSGVCEAFLDVRVLRYVRQGSPTTKNGNGGAPTSGIVSPEQKGKLLLAVVAGNVDCDQAYKETMKIAEGLRITTDTAAIERVKCHLQSLLECQYSYGTLVGAAVVFYAGSFFYGIFDVLSRQGEQGTSLALAFGMWWMICPIIAIIGALLLAANNPSTLASITGPIANPAAGNPPEPRKSLRDTIYPAVTPNAARYKPAWMWDRGQSKRDWIKKVMEENNNISPHLDLSLGDEITMAFCALFLILIPCLLSILTSYFTPKVGIGCRALTTLVYLVCQVCLMLLWFLKSHIKSSFWRILRRCMFLIILSFAIFAAVGGTLMQLVGVYRNCLCALSIWNWIDKRDWILLSTNNRVNIRTGHRFWRQTGGTAVAFLSLVAYVGWWYQRKMRRRFMEAVKSDLIPTNGP